MWTPTTRKQHSRPVTRYQTDLTDAEWRVIAPHLPKPCATGRPRAWPMREILNGIFYVMRAGCRAASCSCACVHIPMCVRATRCSVRAHQSYSIDFSLTLSSIIRRRRLMGISPARPFGCPSIGKPDVCGTSSAGVWVSAENPTDRPMLFPSGNSENGGQPTHKSTKPAA